MKKRVVISLFFSLIISVFLISFTTALDIGDCGTGFGGIYTISNNATTTTPPASNILLNPDFESGNLISATPWENQSWSIPAQGQENRTRDTTKINSGTYSLKVTGPHIVWPEGTSLAGGGTALSQRVNVLTNTTYLLSGWVYDNLSSGQGYIDAGFNLDSCANTSSRYGNYKECCYAVPNKKNEWQFISCYLRTNSTQNQVSVRLMTGLLPLAQNTGDIWFDNISLKVSPTNCMYTNPATSACSCPTGYTFAKVHGALPTPEPCTAGLDICPGDEDVYFCYNTTAKPGKYRFGGAYGYQNYTINIEYNDDGVGTYCGDSVDGNHCLPNSATGDCTCPAGYTAQQITGPYSPANKDMNSFYCYQDASDGNCGQWDFGGMWGYTGMGSIAALLTNPITQGLGINCPTGYTSVPILGTCDRDEQMFSCIKNISYTSYRDADWANLRNISITSACVNETVRIINKTSKFSGNLNFKIYNLSNNNLIASIDSTLNDFSWFINQSGSYYFNISNSSESYNSKSQSYGNLIVSECSVIPTIRIISPVCGSEFNVSQPIEVEIEATGSNVVNINFGDSNTTSVPFDNGIATTSHNYNTPGTKKIIATVTNPHNNIVKRAISNVIIIEPTTKGTFVASCIVSPYDTEELQSSAVTFNASTSKGLTYDPSLTPQKTYTNKENLIFKWTFSDGSRCDFKGNSYTCTYTDRESVSVSDAKGVKGYLFTKRFPGAGKNTASLSVELE